jgi:MerR HTH family regulatory protein
VTTAYLLSDKSNLSRADLEPTIDNNQTLKPDEGYLNNYVQLGVIEPTGSMLHAREIARIAQIQRLRADLGVNLVGAAIVLDLAQEVAQLRAQLEVYRSQPPSPL